jgi:hypothetical protein
VLFPGFGGIVSAHEYTARGAQFDRKEKEEDEFFGKDGFFELVYRVRQSRSAWQSTNWPNLARSSALPGGTGE